MLGGSRPLELLLPRTALLLQVHTLQCPVNPRNSILTVSILLIQEEVCILRWHCGTLCLGLAHNFACKINAMTVSFPMGIVMSGLMTISVQV